MINRLNITPKEINKTCPAGSGEGCPARSEKPENMFEEKKRCNLKNEDPQPTGSGRVPPGRLRGLDFLMI